MNGKRVIIGVGLLILAAGLAAYDRYDCPHCGTKLGTEHKAALVPKLGVNIVWHPKKKNKRENK